jgi:hypothetical protein
MYRCTSLIVEEGAIVRDYRKIRRTEVIKEGGRINY